MFLLHVSLLLDSSVIPAGPFLMAVLGAAVGVVFFYWLLLRGASWAGLPVIKHRKPSLWAALIAAGLPAFWLWGEDQWNLLYWVEVHYGYELRAKVLLAVFSITVIMGICAGVWISPKRKV